MGRTILAAALLLAFPSITLAAYNDLTLTTDAVISVGGYTLNVSGTSATVQSITVNPTDFSVTLTSGSSITISSPTLQQLSSDITSDITNTACTGSESSLTLAYTGSGTITNAITPSASVCTGSGDAPPAPSNGAPAGTALSAPTTVISEVQGTTTTSTTTGISTSSPQQLSASTQQLITLYAALIQLLEREVAVLLGMR